MNTQVNGIASKIRLAVEQGYGHPIKSVNDLKDLQVLLEQKGSFVSYNTLRRFFGFLPVTTPSHQTIQALLAFLGFQSVQAFNASLYQKQSNDIGRWLPYYAAKRDLTAEDIQQLKKLVEEEKQINLLTNLIVALLGSGQQGKLKVVLKNIELTQLDLSLLLHGANNLSMYLRNQERNQWEIMVPFLHAPYHLHTLTVDNHVNYDLINHYFGYFAEQLNTGSMADNDSLYFTLLGRFVQYLKGEDKLPPVRFDGDLMTLPEPLRGRLLAYRLLSGHPDKQWEHAFNEQLLTAQDPQLFFLELTPVLLLTRRFSLLQQVYDKHYDDMLKEDFYSFSSDVYMHLIALGMINFKFGDYRLSASVVSLIHLEDDYLRNVKYYTLFLLILKYHLTLKGYWHEEEAPALMRRYLKLADRLGMKRFSREVMEGFFAG